MESKGGQNELREHPKHLKLGKQIDQDEDNDTDEDKDKRIE